MMGEDRRKATGTSQTPPRGDGQKLAAAEGTRRPAGLWGLVSSTLLLGLGGLYGGISFVLDPSGAAMGLTTGVLARAPVHTFLLPGLFLLVVMGLVPLFLVWSQLARRPWAWTATVGESLLLIGWLIFQYILIGGAAMQIVTGAIGLAMLGFAFVPQVKVHLSNRGRASVGEAHAESEKGAGD